MPTAVVALRRGRTPAAPMLFLLVAALILVAAAARGHGGPQIPVLVIEGPIGPATADYVSRGLDAAAAEGAPFVILRIDTPGGLDTAMREIVRAILVSPIPVVSYVAPSGSRAASAGTYILYASHVAAMAPATNIGAATPIELSGVGAPPRSPDGAGENKGEAASRPHPGSSDKAFNDAIAYIKSLADMRGRNAAWAESSVRDAASLPAEEALKARVIDLIASDLPDLLKRLDGRSVAMPAGAITLTTSGLTPVTEAPDWRTTLLSIITNPSVAAILMLLGIYGIIFEFYSPGFYAPGVIGGICLLLALYAFHLLPINYAGLGLLLLGTLLLAAEAFVPSFGALGIGGLVAFVVGAVLLVDQEIPGLRVAWAIVGVTALVIGGLMTAALTMMARVQRRGALTGAGELLGACGAVSTWDGLSGTVRINGILWQARADRPLPPGSAARVTALDGLTVVVEADEGRERI